LCGCRKFSREEALQKAKAMKAEALQALLGEMENEILKE
jgi:hypothetical protein